MRNDFFGLLFEKKRNEKCQEQNYINANTRTRKKMTTT